ncbi:hypothetical protein I3843_04G068400 [Carya illinoinensis]|nr:hypothetical protein I3843_04G068400 [Carya illinoinensis]
MELFSISRWAFEQGPSCRPYNWNDMDKLLEVNDFSVFYCSILRPNGKAMIESRFRGLLNHSMSLLKKKWLLCILDDFTTKQLPHNVTWGLSLLYAMEHKADQALVATQSELAHALRFLASVVSQGFLAFGDILELHKKIP